MSMRERELTLAEEGSFTDLASSSGPANAGDDFKLTVGSIGIT